MVCHVMVSSYIALEQQDKYCRCPRKRPRKIILAIIISLLIDVGLLKTNVAVRWGLNITRDNPAYMCCSETWNKQVGEKQTHPRHAAVVCFHSSESSCAQAACFTAWANCLPWQIYWKNNMAEMLALKGPDLISNTQDPANFVSVAQQIIIITWDERCSDLTD